MQARCAIINQTCPGSTRIGSAFVDNPYTMRLNTIHGPYFVPTTKHSQQSLPTPGNPHAPLRHVVAGVAISRRIHHQPLDDTVQCTTNPKACFRRHMWVLARVRVPPLECRRRFRLEELTRRFWHLCGNTWVGGRFQGLHLRRF